ncbi:hypothetical protein AG1IA_06048 [Rhizoctonia solani AG-1 IA]|uniref:Uncharacterized protein n=1 Tax=Thanatephorus cucumeris (strain AG1-IA) TaxID=983506 RepID=L8WT45_THACA|nr:hypothetical protein AG1IA_06048 [Rhizoctonia solani AG-1 IA]
MSTTGLRVFDLSLLPDCYFSSSPSWSCRTHDPFFCYLYYHPKPTITYALD